MMTYMLAHIPIWLRLILVGVLLYLVVAMVVHLVADRMIFLPPRASYGDDLENLHMLQTEDDESIAALHLPARGNFPTLLYSHGNAEDLGHSLDFYRSCQRAGFGVLVYDYPGYGQSTGKPTEASCERAILAGWEFLINDQKLSPNEIVVVGLSVGSGPSVWLDTQKSPRAMVLIAPFKSTYAVMSPADRLFFGNRFPNIGRIRQSTTPLLIVHGELDRVIPPAHGRALHAASPAEPKQFLSLADAGHNDLYQLAEAEVIAAMRDFCQPPNPTRQ